MTPTDHVSDLLSARDWLRSLADLDMKDIAADGGVTVAMVVQQEAREMAGRLDRALASPPAGDGNSQWRCFHCDFATSDRDEAELHFGSRPIYDPMCRMTDAGQRREYITLDASYSRVCEELRALKTAAASPPPPAEGVGKEEHGSSCTDLSCAQTHSLSAEAYNAIFDPADEAGQEVFSAGWKCGWMFANYDGCWDDEAEEDYGRQVDGVAIGEAWDAHRDQFFARLPLAALPDRPNAAPVRPEEGDATGPEADEPSAAGGGA